MQATCSEEELKQFHIRLLDAYTSQGQVPINQVPDDGYIVQVCVHARGGVCLRVLPVFFCTCERWCVCVCYQCTCERWCVFACATSVF